MSFLDRLWHRLLGFDPHRDRSFPGQQPGEEVELLTVFHGIRIIPLIIYVLVLILALILVNIFADFSPQLAFYINTVSVAVIIHIFCWRLYNHFLKVIIVTNIRIIYIQHSVLLERERETITLANVQDIHFKQSGIIPRIFGYGDLVILGSSTDIKYHFKYVPKVNKVHHLLCEVHQRNHVNNLHISSNNHNTV